MTEIPDQTKIEYKIAIFPPLSTEDAKVVCHRTSTDLEDTVRSLLEELGYSDIMLSTSINVAQVYKA